MLTAEIKQISSEIFEPMIQIRRQFHQNPELSFKEFETAAFIKKYLTSLNLNVQDNIAITGIVGLLPLKSGVGSTIAVRADMDALPIVELNKMGYASKNKGVMHACGHDFHMTILLGVATVLSRLSDKLSGKVKFIFQPGEEGYAGAKKMVEEGVLESPKVDAILATHVAPWLKTGQVSICSGPAMASPSEFKIIIKGKSGHAAQPQKCINPILIGIHLVDVLQKIVVPKENPVENAVLTVTSFAAGNSHNIIPEEASIMGTVRTFSPSLDYRIFREMEALVENTTKSMGAGFKLFYNIGYPPVINDEQVVSRFCNSASKIISPQNLFSSVKPLMLAEDFAYYLQKVPGAMFNLGCSLDNEEEIKGLHSCKFFPDENAIKYGIELIAQAVVDLLEVPLK